MTNFEKITQSEAILADWLFYGVEGDLCCDQCPVCEECRDDDGPNSDRCFRLIYKWLKREA